MCVETVQHRQKQTAYGHERSREMDKYLIQNLKALTGAEDITIEHEGGYTGIVVRGEGCTPIGIDIWVDDAGKITVKSTIEYTPMTPSLRDQYEIMMRMVECVVSENN